MIKLLGLNMLIKINNIKIHLFKTISLKATLLNKTSFDSIKKYYLLISIFMTCGLLPNTAFADLPVIDFASLAQLIKQISWMEQQYQMLSKQYGILQQEESSVLNQATDIHTQLNALKSLNAGQFQWTNLSGTLSNLGNSIGSNNGLSYDAGNINSQFSSLFPGYINQGDYFQNYQNNVDATQNTLNGVMQSLNQNNNDFNNAQSRLGFLEAQAQNAQGQTQAIQASAQIQAEQVAQIELLRQTLMTQTNAQTVYEASQTQQAAAKENIEQNFVNSGSVNTPAYGSGSAPVVPQIP